MNSPGDTTNLEKNCGITSLIPLGMSCRGRAEAFARRLQSRLRTLGSQGSSTLSPTSDQPDSLSESTWLQQQQQHQSHQQNENQLITDVQPTLRHHNLSVNNASSSQEVDSFFDFDIENESPGSPIEECEYTQLIESNTITPIEQQDVNQLDNVISPDTGYICASPISSIGSGSNHAEDSCSSDGPYYDLNETSESEQKSSLSLSIDYYDCYDSNKIDVQQQQQLQQNHYQQKLLTNTSVSDQDFKNYTTLNGNHDKIHPERYSTIIINDSSDSGSESLPISQSTTASLSTCTAPSSTSNSTLHDECYDLPTTSSITIDPTNTTANQQLLVNGYHENHENDENSINYEYTLENSIEKINQKIMMSIEHEHNIKDNHLTNGFSEDVTDNISQPPSMESASSTTTTTTNPHISQLNIENPFALEFSMHLLNIKENNNLTNIDKETTYSNEFNIINGENENEEQQEEQLTDATEPSESATQQNFISNNKENLEIPLKVKIYEHDEEETQPQRVRRCSSLKTGKTPPGTPGRKKIVRFADVLGLDLADVRTFLDDVPKVPKSAYSDLEMSMEQMIEPSPLLLLGPCPDKILMPMFQQPGGLPGFLDLVKERQVSLENAAVTDPICLTITGCVRVRNLDFHKSVHLRYSLDGWRSYADLQANYVENSCDGFSDKFSFTLFGNALQIGQRIEIAVRFSCKGQQFWDNNYGTNYCFQCLPATIPSSIRSVVQQLPFSSSTQSSSTSSSSVIVSSPSKSVPQLSISPESSSWCGTFY